MNRTDGHKLPAKKLKGNKNRAQNMIKEEFKQIITRGKATVPLLSQEKAGNVVIYTPGRQSSNPAGKEAGRRRNKTKN